jgi:hypothetical protein
MSFNCWPWFVLAVAVYCKPLQAGLVTASLQTVRI